MTTNVGGQNVGGQNVPRGQQMHDACGAPTAGPTCWFASGIFKRHKETRAG